MEKSFWGANPEIVSNQTERGTAKVTVKMAMGKSAHKGMSRPLP
jgi:hypothetical protein